MPNGNPYETLFARHRSARVPTLWGWQSEVLAAYATFGGDAAVELISTMADTRRSPTVPRPGSRRRR